MTTDDDRKRRRDDAASELDAIEVWDAIEAQRAEARRPAGDADQARGHAMSANDAVAAFWRPATHIGHH